MEFCYLNTMIFLLESIRCYVGLHDQKDVIRQRKHG